MPGQAACTKGWWRNCWRQEKGRAREDERLHQVKTTPAYDLLDSVSELLLSLNLVDPRSPAFSPENCRTLHDITRFVHEKSYEEMFQMGEHLGDMRDVSTHLDVFLPIDLYIIDLGGGIDAPAGTRRLKPSHVASVPLKALLDGMLDKRIPRFGPRPMDLRGFMSIMARHAVTNPEEERTFRDPCYVLVSDEYLNYTARVGYHFSVVDAYCGEALNKNYISLLFRGGAADYTRRHRRIRAIGGILEHFGFSMNVRGDAVTARLSKRSREETASQLEMIGRLFQFFRQMDAAMKSEQAVVQMQEAFIRGDFSFRVNDQNPANGVGRSSRRCQRRGTMLRDCLRSSYLRLDLACATCFFPGSFSGPPGSFPPGISSWQRLLPPLQRVRRCQSASSSNPTHRT